MLGKRPPPPVHSRTEPVTPRLRAVLRMLPEGGAEQRAIEAGEIDAVIDYDNANLILFPAARRARHAVEGRGSAVRREASNDAPAANSLLAVLPRAQYQRLLGGLEPVMLKCGEVLHEPGEPIRHVYFPIDSVVCLLMTAQSQRAVEVGLVGYEGMVGLSLVFGVDVAAVRAQVQNTGLAMRMPAARFVNEFRRCLPLRSALYGFTHLKLAQARQTAACVSTHLFGPRLACWLLMTSDRARSQDISLTHEALAATFGVRRVTVTEACAALRSLGLISYSRGQIEILDRKGLEAASCSCYTRIAGPRANTAA